MKTKGEVAASALTAGTIALNGAMFNHWEGRIYVAVQLPFDPLGVVKTCGGITNHDWPKAGMKLTEEQCQKAINELIPRYAVPVMVCISLFKSMPPHRQAAVLSFTINLASSVTCGSVGRLINAGDTKLSARR